MTTRIALPQANNSYVLMHAVMSWDPPSIPHCSNCRHAIVSGGVSGPIVECAQAHGRGAISLFRLIRPKQPRGFRAAITCPDFASMSDEDDDAGTQ